MKFKMCCDRENENKKHKLNKKKTKDTEVNLLRGQT